MILVLDFGSQTTHLISRRLREMGYPSEVVNGTAKLNLHGVKGIILSGSPHSVYTSGSPHPNKVVYNCGLPLLGICYGLQVMNVDNGGTVKRLDKVEYGGIEISVTNGPFDLGKFKAWMSHSDTIDIIAPGFVCQGITSNHMPAVMYHKSKPWYGLQFHPEVKNCEKGNDFLRKFAEICKEEKTWSIAKYLEDRKKYIRRIVGKKDVLCFVSGGVDSTVLAALLLESLDSKQVYLLYIDTGLMRKQESEQILDTLKSLGAQNLCNINASERFFNALSGLVDPEDKRRIIGDCFVKIQEAAQLGLSDYLLAQGTLYTDAIESGKGIGKQANVIKTHHNVGSPLITKMREDHRLLEPLDQLYKDEVRELGKELGLSDNIIWRHPFPGPGLGIRVIGEVTPDKVDILRRADHVFIRELKTRGLYRKIWQAFAVLLPVKSVGVAGDERKYGYTIVLRAITSEDGMTADIYPLDDIVKISTIITNEVPEVGRVVYDVSSKPPATIEWE